MNQIKGYKEKFLNGEEIPSKIIDGKRKLNGYTYEKNSNRLGFLWCRGI